jgi:hypothetical protein
MADAVPTYVAQVKDFFSDIAFLFNLEGTQTSTPVGALHSRISWAANSVVLRKDSPQAGQYACLT